MDFNAPHLEIRILPVEDGKNYQVIEFQGDLDKAGLSAVRDKIESLIENFDKPFLVFDLGSLNFINSESIGYLMSIHTHLAKKGKNLALVQAKSNVKDVFTVIGLFQVIEYADSMDQFLQKHS